MRRLIMAVLVSQLAGPMAFAQEEAETQAPVATEGQEEAGASPSETLPVSSSEASNERQWRVGPTVNVSLLPVSVGIDATYGKQFSGGFHMGSMPYNSDKVDLKFQSWDLVGRWHPWMSSFFVGVGYVSQSIDIEATDKIDDGAGNKISTKLSVGVDTNYLMPHIGWMAVWDSGFTLGFEIGYKMHMNHKTDKLKTEFVGADAAQTAAVTATEDYKKQSKNVNDAVDAFGEASMPYINLLKIGYLF